MAITPQAIKDQEFQSKFRGYDTIEVKAYLELIAEEFFELLEDARKHTEEVEIFTEEKETLLAEKQSVEENALSFQEECEEKDTELASKQEEIALLEKIQEELNEKIQTLENEKLEQQEEIKAILEENRAKDAEIEGEKAQAIELQHQIDVLKKQTQNLDDAEVDFKSTLVMAQKFSNEMKEKSEAESQEIIDVAIEEAEKLRSETLEELARYPKEIEVLKKKRNQVKEDLEKILRVCLENLEVFGTVGDYDDDTGELFQSIEIPDNLEENTKEFENIDMDFSSPVTSADSSEEFSLDDSGESLS